MRPLLALAMIVRDEAHCLARTLESVNGVCDTLCVLDTGSTDGTQALVKELIVSFGARGGLHEYAFEGYAESRNRALVLASAVGDEERARWALSLSADEVVCGGDKLRAFLESYAGDETALLVEVRTPTGMFDYPRLLAVGSPWRYEGEVHEVPVHQMERSRTPVVKVPGCRIEYAPSDPARFSKRLRERDIPILTKRLADEKDPAKRAEAVMYLARTREQIAATITDDVASASQEMFSALGWYALLSMTEDAPKEARRDAAWHYLNVAEMLGVYLPQEMVPRLQTAAKADPENPAIAYMLARHVANIGPDGVIRGDARAGMQAAQRAAKLAMDQVQDKSAPHDPHGLLWRPHFIAAVCAKALGHGTAAKKSAQAGIDAGGPRDVFEQFLR